VHDVLRTSSTEVPSTPLSTHLGVIGGAVAGDVAGKEHHRPPPLLAMRRDGVQGVSGMAAFATVPVAAAMVTEASEDGSSASSALYT
jgi:hypothetical protein